MGLLSDALESVINLVASVLALLALWYAARPPDAEHTYGHEKISYFSSGIEGMLILIRCGYHRLGSGRCICSPHIRWTTWISD